MRPSRRQCAQLVVGALVGHPRLVRMDAGRRRQAVARGDLQRAPVAGRLVDAANDQHLGQPGRPGARHHLVAVGVEVRQVEVTVAVDQREARLSHDLQL